MSFAFGSYAKSSVLFGYNEHGAPYAATCNVSPVAKLLALVAKSIAPDAAAFTCSRLPISAIVITYGLTTDDVIMVLVNTPVLICKELLTIPAGNMVGANDAEVANDDVNGVNVIDLAADAVVANDAEVILPLKLPVLICKELLTIPVGNIVGAKDAEVANDAEIAVLASPINDPVKLPVLICKELLTIPDGSMVGANDAEVANDDVNGVNVIDVAADAVVANDAEMAVLASPINDPVKLPVLICRELLTIPDGSMVGANDAVVENDDVNGVNVIDVAADAVVANDDVNGVNVIDVAADAVVANDAEMAVLASPINDPVKLPVLICKELLTIPAGNIVGANDAEVILPLKLPVLICKELLTIPAGNMVGAKDADVILPLKLPVLIWVELLTVPAGINLNPVNAADLLTSASKFTIIDDDTVLSNICKPDIFAVVIIIG